MLVYKSVNVSGKTESMWKTVSNPQKYYILCLQIVFSRSILCPLKRGIEWDSRSVDNSGTAV